MQLVFGLFLNMHHSETKQYWAIVLVFSARKTRGSVILAWVQHYSNTNLSVGWL